jgi:hypothetical protein
MDEEGTVTKVIDTGGILRESSHLEFYSGIITPGFVLPCYRLPVRSGAMSGSAFRAFDRLLFIQGIKGIGIIERQAGHFALKKESPVTYHTIVELCPCTGQEEFEVYREGMDRIMEGWNDHGQTCSLSCCTSSLMETDMAAYMLQYAALHQGVIPLEHSDKWPLAEQLAKLEQQLERLSEDPPPGLFKNTHLVILQESPEGYTASDQQGILPTFHGFRPADDLNVLASILAWQESFKKQSLMDILPLFTSHAATALFEDYRLGSIEPGKVPGLNLLTNADTAKFRLTGDSVVKVLV